MATAAFETAGMSHRSLVGALPARMRVLHVAGPRRSDNWLAEALAADGACDCLLEQVFGAAAGMARLRDESYELVLLVHEPPELDALELAQALRTGGAEEPILVLGDAAAEELAPLAFEVGADDYLCIAATAVRSLLWSAARAIERHQLVRENRRLIQAQRQRLQHEHEEADRLLAQQRALIGDLESLAENAGDAAEDKPAAISGDDDSPRALWASRLPGDLCSDGALLLPDQLVGHYAELLRTYVIMGSGNLSVEMSKLAELLVSTGVTPQQAMLLHLKVVEELVHGLGTRSARHVLNRADLLVLEVMVHLAEGYRGRYLERSHPPHQLPLPVF
jgi:DNA-binding response OmpR family regulator